MTKPELTEQEVIEFIREGTVETLKELSRALEDDKGEKEWRGKDFYKNLKVI